MISWQLLDTAAVPGSASELRLWRRGDEYSIRIDGAELMNSRLSGSEEALATLACDKLGDRERPEILVGGLGMGFTLRAALAVLDGDATVTVCELVPAVVAWAKGPMAALSGASLADARVRVVEDDVATLIRARPSAYDAILLDVDNGPEGMTHAGNDRLYDANGLAAVRGALTPGGILTVWSARPDNAFTKRLKRSGFAVEEHHVRANRGKRGATHTIWLGVATSAPPRLPASTEARRSFPPRGSGR